jgi:hypothetical protein
MTSQVAALDLQRVAVMRACHLADEGHGSCGDWEVTSSTKAATLEARKQGMYFASGLSFRLDI